MKKRFKLKLSPYFVILAGFFLLAIAGFLLLLLPVSTKTPIAAVDAFFLSVSALCITGLSSVDLASTFTGFGQAVIALLIQVGGLGFVTIAMTAIAMIGSRLGIVNRLLVDETLGANGRLDYRKFLIRVILITVIAEGIGFLLNLIALRGEYAGGKLVWLSLFHSVSAFNNAGLDLFGGMTRYQDNVLLLLNTSFLTIAGGLGFIVIIDIIYARRWKKFTVHTKVVLIMTFALLTLGTLLLMLTEWGKLDFLNAFFMSAMARTCGFSTQDLGSWSNASLCVINLLMFIGAGPASTGGGIKCSTCFVFLASLYALVRGKHTTVFRRRISHEALIHAMIVTVIAFVYAFTTGTVLCALEPALPLTFLFTETVSALANVGFSAGITSSLTVGSKLMLALAMYVGRVGFITVLLACRRHWKRVESAVRYPEADIIIG